jgi:hypothetical protein
MSENLVSHVTAFMIGLCVAGVCVLAGVVTQEGPEQEPTTERQVLEALWHWEQFAKRSDRNTGLQAEEIATRVGTHDAYAAIVDLEERGRVHRWRDGRYHLWEEER